MLVRWAALDFCALALSLNLSGLFIDLNCENSVSAPTDDVALLHQGLLKLSPLHREVLTLFYLEDFSSPQIAEIVGLPEGTIKSRLHNARKNLAEALREAGYERPR